VLARAARADEAVLGALVALDLGVLEGGPVADLVAEAADILLHDFCGGNAFEFLRARMPCGHGGAPVFRCVDGI
jgi:hypothetical protein